jgi:hypothetical protein
MRSSMPFTLLARSSRSVLGCRRRSPSVIRMFFSASTCMQRLFAALRSVRVLHLRISSCNTDSANTYSITEAPEEWSHRSLTMFMKWCYSAVDLRIEIL